jgi:hypothetical protein
MKQARTRVRRIERQQHARFAHDPVTPITARTSEPAEHDRAENFADRAGAVALDEEQSEKHHDGDRQHRNLRGPARRLQPSTALNTDIAGVMAPSAKNSAAPKYPRCRRVCGAGSPVRC